MASAIGRGCPQRRRGWQGIRVCIALRLRGSLFAAAAAILISLLLHGLGLNVASPDIVNEPDGARTEPPETGGSFEDFAEVAPETPEPEVTEPTPPPEMTAPEPVEDITPTSEALVATDSPQYDRAPDSGTAEAVSPDAPEPAESPVPEAAPPPQGEAETATPAQTAETIEPDATTEGGEEVAETVPEEAEVPEEAQEEAPEEMVQPDEPEMTVAALPEEPEIPIETGEETTEVTAVTRSLRPPKARPTAESLGARAETKDGGSVNGSERTRIQSSGLELLAQEGSIASTGASPFDTSRATGNASTTNYAGRVLMQLNRSRRITSSAQGTARVQFQIDEDGSVAWVRVLTSSGSAGIERAAAAQVRSSAPFPRPPEGTSRRLVFVYHSD